MVSSWTDEMRQLRDMLRSTSDRERTEIRGRQSLLDQREHRRPSWRSEPIRPSCAISILATEKSRFDRRKRFVIMFVELWMNADTSS
jgi:hypothetical protein